MKTACHGAVNVKITAGGGTLPDTVFFTGESSDSENGAYVEWVLGSEPGTDNSVVATSRPGDGLADLSATLRIIPEEADLDIRIVPDSRLLARPEVLAAVDSARASWETVIRGDLPGSTGTKQMVEGCIAGADFDLPDGRLLD